MNAEPPHPFAANRDPAHLIDAGVVRDLERWWHRYSDVVDIDEGDLFRLLLAIGQMAQGEWVGSCSLTCPVMIMLSVGATSRT